MTALGRGPTATVERKNGWQADNLRSGFRNRSRLNRSSEEQRMNTRSKCVGLTMAAACSMYLPGLASAQVFPAQGPRNLIVGQELEIGNVGDNEGQNDGRQRSGGQGYQDHYQSAPTQLASIPFTGRYRNTCYGFLFVEETPAGIIVSVNGQSVQARNSDELRQRYPDAFLLYDRTVGLQKRQLLGRFAELKSRYSDANLAFASGGMPGQLDTNLSQDGGISLIENGKKVSITRTETGIAVSVNGKRVRTNNVSQLRKTFPEAFRMFEERLASPDGDDG